MLRSRIAFAAALLGALKLFVQAFATPSPLARRSLGVGRVSLVPIPIPVDIVYVEIVHVLVVGSAAAPPALNFFLLLDMVRRRGLLELRHGVRGPGCGRGPFNVCGVRGEDGRHAVRLDHECLIQA